MEAFIILLAGGLVAYALLKRQSVEQQVSDITEMYTAVIPDSGTGAPQDSGGDPLSIAVGI
jgi:hypothetical protein